MPKNDTPQTAVTSQQPTVSTPPPVLEDIVLPPMVSSVPKVNDQKQETNSGSAAPSNDVVMNTTPISTMPRKKYAGGKIIATILGLFLLVGGLGAGVYLTGQDQNVNEKASTVTCTNFTGYGNNTTLPAAGTAVSYCPNGTDVSGGCNASGSNQNGTNATIPEGFTENSCFCGTFQYDTGNGTHYSITGNDCGGGGGTGVDCRHETVNCPTGSSVDYNQPLSKSCFNQGDQGKWCAGPGTAQKQTDCCGTDAAGDCTNPEYTTYNCCPTNTSSQCTTSYTEYSAFPEAGGCGIDTELSRVQKECYLTTNDKGHWVTICPIELKCKKAVTTCVCAGTPPPVVTPSPEPITASCQNVQAYSEDWTLLTQAQLSALKPADNVNFCVAGVATGGSFNKAKFTINGAVQAETTLIRPSSTDFCQLYTIPNGTTTFNVTAQINHVTLGWK